MLTLIPFTFWAMLLLCIVAYAFFGIYGVVGLAVIAFLTRHF